MDKNTLSQYGWVVIVIIVIIILLALATPFGTFVKSNVKESVIAFAEKMNTTFEDAELPIDTPVFDDNEPIDASPTNYTPEEIDADDHLIAIGKTNVNYVVARFNDNYTVMTILKNGPDSDGDWVGTRHAIQREIKEKYGDKIRKIIVGDGLTYVSNLGLSNYKRAETVVLPDTITELKGQAFTNNSRLSQINIPSGLKIIGYDAFYSTKITTMILPEGLEEIRSNAFYGSALKRIVIPSTVTVVQGFNNCQYLTEVVLPEGPETLGDYAFGITPLLKTIFIPNSITSISTSAFDMSGLETVQCHAGSYAESWAQANGYNIEYV